MNFENEMSPDEMSHIKGGYWVLTEDGWIWVDDNLKLNDDNSNL